MPLEIDAALGGPWERIGAALTAAGCEDASGARRALAGMLIARDWERIMRWLACTHAEAELLRAAVLPDEPANGYY